MADIYDWSTTAADNDDADSTINWLEGQLPGTVNGSARAMMKRVKELLNDLTYSGTVGGTADAITLTSAIGALADNKVVTFKASADNTGAVTLAVNGLTAKAIRKISAGADVALSAGDIEEAVRYVVVYDSAANSSAGAWIIVGSSASVAAATTSAAGIVPLNYFGIPQNIGLAASVGASALTIALKGADGNDPSASNPVIIPFRNVTAGTGTPTFLTVTAATSIVISSGSTLGMTSAVAATLAVVGFNDGGTFRLGLINPLVRPLNDGIASSTAEGGAGGADSAGVIYTGSAVASKAMTVLGYATVTEATAGTWATAPATLKLAAAPEFNNVVPIVTPLVAYTPTFTGFGTPTNVSIFSQKVGDVLWIRGHFTTGTATATEARISLGFNGTDGNVTSDATKVNAIQAAGGSVMLSGGTGAAIISPLIESGVTYLTFGLQSATEAGLTKQNGNAAFASSRKYTINASVPISGW